MAVRATGFTPGVATYDPYRKFKFKIKINGSYVAGLNKCSALTVNVDVQDFRTGDQDSFPLKIPGQVSFEAITLEQGVTTDPTFENWATAMSNFVANEGTDVEKTPEDFRKEIDIEIQNLKGEIVKKYRVFNCWVSKYTAMPDLDASSNEVMIQTLELQNEGWKVIP